ncbi:hypothetical protein GCM10023223_25570 [Stackebrandtia albiflava]
MYPPYSINTPPAAGSITVMRSTHKYCADGSPKIATVVITDPMDTKAMRAPININRYPRWRRNASRLGSSTERRPLDRVGSVFRAIVTPAAESLGHRRRGRQ